MSSRIISTINQYLGINAHLHSHFLRAEPEGWKEFHASHITDLTRALNRELVPMGYIARQERSLQIQHFDETISSPISDVLVSDPLTARVGLAEARAMAFNVPAATLLERDPADEKRPFAVKIYAQREARETPVVWIELLSPSNKSGSGYASYVAKREALLANWLVFVEIDYLHGASTTLARIPDYRPPGRDARPRENAQPYHLWWIDPRLSPDDPRSGAVAAFGVDQPIPRFGLPLNEGQTVSLDFNAVYHQTFNAQPAFGLAVDYAVEPAGMADDYNARDQAAIRARMRAVAAHVAAGDDLRAGPFAAENTAESE